MKGYIAIYIDNLERYRFFKCFFKSINHNGYTPLIFSNKASVLLKGKLDGVEVKSLVWGESESKLCISLSDSIDVLNNVHNVDFAKKLSSSVLANLSCDIFNKVEFFFIWNGSNTIAKTISEFCKKKSINTVFFELSNLPGKVFVDPEGVNAKSYLYKKPELLDKYPFVDDDVFIKWLDSYELYKKNPIPQASIKYKINFYSFLDFFGIFLGLANQERRSLLNKIRLKLYFFSKKKKRAATTYDHIDFKSENYNFLPLQVCSDTQIKINSEVDNLGALKKAKEYSLKQGVKLYVKIHPAEENVQFIEYVKNMQDQSLIVTDQNTVDLIKYSRKVIVINSTVGLESMLYGKSVEVLGRAIYQDFDNQRLRKFIKYHLFDIEYFNPKDVGFEDIKKILKKFW